MATFTELLAEAPDEVRLMFFKEYAAVLIMTDEERAIRERKIRLNEACGYEPHYGL